MQVLPPQALPWLAQVLRPSVRVTAPPVLVQQLGLSALRLQRVHPGTLIKAQTNVALVPRPRTRGVPSVAVEGAELLKWAAGVVSIFGASKAVVGQ